MPRIFPCRTSFLRSTEDRRGVRVKLIASEIRVAPVITTANGVKYLPTIELIIAIGMKTTTFVLALAKTGRATSELPTEDASAGFIPSAIFLVMFSITTIEFVTSTPTEVPNARRVELLNV